MRSTGFFASAATVNRYPNITTFDSLAGGVDGAFTRPCGPTMVPTEAGDYYADGPINGDAGTLAHLLFSYRASIRSYICEAQHIPGLGPSLASYLQNERYPIVEQVINSDLAHLQSTGIPEERPSDMVLFAAEGIAKRCAKRWVEKQIEVAHAATAAGLANAEFEMVEKYAAEGLHLLTLNDTTSTATVTHPSPPPLFTEFLGSAPTSHHLLSFQRPPSTASDLWVVSDVKPPSNLSAAAKQALHRHVQIFKCQFIRHKAQYPEVIARNMAQEDLRRQCSSPKDYRSVMQYLHREFKLARGTMGSGLEISSQQQPLPATAATFGSTPSPAVVQGTIALQNMPASLSLSPPTYQSYSNALSPPSTQKPKLNSALRRDHRFAKLEELSKRKCREYAIGQTDSAARLMTLKALQNKCASGQEFRKLVDELSRKGVISRRTPRAARWNSDHPLSDSSSSSSSLATSPPTSVSSRPDSQPSTPPSSLPATPESSPAPMPTWPVARQIQDGVEIAFGAMSISTVPRQDPVIADGLAPYDADLRSGHDDAGQAMNDLALPRHRSTAIAVTDAYDAPTADFGAQPADVADDAVRAFGRMVLEPSPANTGLGIAIPDAATVESLPDFEDFDDHMGGDDGYEAEREDDDSAGPLFRDARRAAAAGPLKIVRTRQNGAAGARGITKTGRARTSTRWAGSDARNDPVEIFNGTDAPRAKTKLFVKPYSSMHIFQECIEAENGSQYWSFEWKPQPRQTKKSKKQLEEVRKADQSNLDRLFQVYRAAHRALNAAGAVGAKFTKAIAVVDQICALLPQSCADEFLEAVLQL